MVKTGKKSVVNHETTADDIPENSDGYQHWDTRSIVEDNKDEFTSTGFVLMIGSSVGSCESLTRDIPNMKRCS